MKNKVAVYSTLGARNYAKNVRQKDDFYATPPIAITKLLEKEKFHNNIWECACGEGHISRILKFYGYKVRSTDLFYRGYGKGGIDFMNVSKEDLWYYKKSDIITNPPYKYALKFVEKALSLVDDGYKVAMLLRIQFLESKSRKKLFEENPPKVVYVFSERIGCWQDGKPTHGSAICFCWFVWEKGYKGDPIIKWI